MCSTEHDFDFLIGSWAIRNRYLEKRLQGSTEWSDFDGSSDAQVLLNGLGNLERYSAVRNGKSFDGITLRLFDPSKAVWSLYWADTVRAGVLQPPMIGKFQDGVGEFFGDEKVAGERVLCRFIWTPGKGGVSPQWEQAFSDNGGKTWETNWVMTFTRK